VEPYYYAFGAFLAGFSERFATGMLGAGERKLTPNEPPDEDQPESPGETNPI
jgi:hypothetical protein